MCLCNKVMQRKLKRRKILVLCSLVNNYDQKLYLISINFSFSTTCGNGFLKFDIMFQDDGLHVHVCDTCVARRGGVLLVIFSLFLSFSSFFFHFLFNKVTTSFYFILFFIPLPTPPPCPHPVPTRISTL